MVWYVIQGILLTVYFVLSAFVLMLTRLKVTSSRRYLSGVDQVRCGSSEWIIIALLIRIATVQNVSDSRLWLSVVPSQLKLRRAEEGLVHQEAV